MYAKGGFSIDGKEGVHIHLAQLAISRHCCVREISVMGIKLVAGGIAA